MSHLAPFAYVQQLVCVVALLLLFVRRVSQSEHGWRRVLAWRRLRALQLRSVVALTLVCALLCLLAYSVVLTVVKYDRVDEDRKHSLRRTGAYLWTAHAVLRTSSLFLVVAEWYAMTSDIQTPRSLSRFEFHLVYVWTLVSACLHIALRAIYHAEDDRACTNGHLLARLPPSCLSLLPSLPPLYPLSSPPMRMCVWCSGTTTALLDRADRRGRRLPGQCSTHASYP
ncbi:MAG: hypothetical protein MHM6MM_002910 [Cercozoa sp. M6MM]